MNSGPSFLLTFLYYFSGTTLIVAFIIAKSKGLDLGTTNPYPTGILFGVAAGLLGASYNRTVSRQVTTAQPQQFTAQLQQCLNVMGYAETPPGSTSPLESFRQYDRQGLSKLFSGSLYIQLEGKTATIVGRAANVRTLVKLLEQPPA